MSQDIGKFLSSAFYRASAVYPVIIGDVLVVLECAKKFLETGDMKHVQHMCTIVNMFLKKVREVLKYCEHNVQQVLTRYVNELTALYNDVVKVSLSGGNEDIAQSIRNLCSCLVKLCRDLVSAYVQEIDRYLREVASRLGLIV